MKKHKQQQHEKVFEKIVMMFTIIDGSKRTITINDIK